MKKEVCHKCHNEIDEFNENEYFGINWKVYCSLECFYEDDKKQPKPKAEDQKFFGKIASRIAKVAKRSQANKNDKRKNKVHKKKSKQKKRKR